MKPMNMVFLSEMARKEKETPIVCSAMNDAGKTAYFNHQFDTGEGDYTIERERLLSGISMEDALHELGIIRRG